MLFDTPMTRIYKDPSLHQKNFILSIVQVPNDENIALRSWKANRGWKLFPEGFSMESF